MSQLGQCERCGITTDVTLEEYQGNTLNLWYLCERCKKETQELLRCQASSEGEKQ